MSKRFWPLSAVSALCLASLMGCNDKYTTPIDPGTDPADLSAQGMLRDVAGHPVAGAEIRVFPVGYLAQASDALGKRADGVSQAFQARTDADGHYTLPAVTPGLYNILSVYGDDANLRDSIFLPARGELADTLRASASLKGRVEVEPGDDPRGFAVQMVGLPYRAWLDMDGNFSLAGLPAGRLRLRIARDGSADYREGNLNVTLVQGKEKTLEEPIALVFLNLPSVKRLLAEVDTATGIVKLTWSRTVSPLIDHYIVRRENSLSDPYNPYWIPVEDTVFYDTLFPAGRIITRTGNPTGAAYTTYLDSSVAKVQYRVAAAGRNDLTGTFTEKARVEAPAPWTVTTRFAFGDDTLPFMLLSAGQKGRLGLSLANPTRKVKKLEWKDARGSLLRSIALDAKQGQDTLEIDPLAVGDSMQVRVEATDGSGHVWMDSLLVLGAPWKRLADRPMPVYGKVAKYQVDLPMLALDGKIYALGSHGLESHTASTVFDPATGKWSTIAEAPALGNMIGMGGKAYLASGDNLYVYAPGQDRWDSVADLVPQANIFGVRPIFQSDGKIAVGSSDRDYWATYFDPGTAESNRFPSVDSYYGPFTIQFTTARKAYLQYANCCWSGFQGLVSYSWASGVLTNISNTFYSLTNNPVEINGYHYFVSAGGTMTVFDENRETFESRVGPAFPAFGVYPYPYIPPQVDVHVIGGRLFAFCQTRSGLVEVKSYAPGARDWKAELPLTIRGDRFATAEADGVIYLLGFYGKDDSRFDQNPAFYEYRPQP